MTSIPDEKIGDATIRIVAEKGRYRGTLIRKGKMSEVEEDDSLSRLQVRLRNKAGTLHPAYIGMAGAIERFISFFPNGFRDIAFDVDERRYKVENRRKLLAALPLQRAATASADDARSVRPVFGTNILSRFELARSHPVLGSAQGPAYVRAAARFASGDLAGGLAGMVAAIAPHGRHSWPMLTYLPQLWCSDEHMFLKPQATLDFAQRVGHRFQFDYSADPLPHVYESLIDLVETTEAALERLGPEGRIDVQSFIWVVGSYTENDLPRLQQLRASG
jgi:hypothetical protein